MKKTRKKQVRRCVCGRSLPHPFVPPGTPWTWSAHPESVPLEVVAQGHSGHEPSEGCCCIICLSMR